MRNTKYLFFILLLSFFYGGSVYADSVVTNMVANPSSFNTDNGYQYVTLSFDISDDDGVCIKNDGCYPYSYIRAEDSTFLESEVIRISGSNHNGSYSVNLVFAPGADVASSQYADNDLIIYDQKGDRTKAGINDKLINEGVVVDRLAPQYEIQSIYPTYLTAGIGGIVTITLKISDDISGICASGDDNCASYSTIGVYDPEDILEDLGVIFRTLSLSRISGDRLDGIYTLRYYVPSKTPVGSYRIAYDIRDQAQRFNEMTLEGRNALIVRSPLINMNKDDVVYRFYSEKFKGHFYTTSPYEANQIIGSDENWSFEGVAYDALTKDDAGAMPIYRFWSDQYQHHFYTVSEFEKDQIIANDFNWNYEGIAYYAYASNQEDSTPVYRFWSDEFKGHFYTSSQSEKDYIITNDSNWTYEGIAWWAK